MVEYLTEYIQDLCDDYNIEYSYDTRYRTGYIDALNDVRTAMIEYVEQAEEQEEL
jgi:hypothetical protein